jgi:hypothetical protein
MAELDWQSIITDEREIKMFEALENPKWDWRTVRALSRESGLDQEAIKKIIKMHPELIRKSDVQSQNGEDLYTLQSRFYKRKRSWEFLSSSI